MAFIDSAAFRETPNFRARRRRALVRVQLFNAQNVLQDVMVVNISSTGIRATARIKAPDKDEVISVHLPDGTELWGIVRWVSGRDFGVEFDVSSPIADFGTDKTSPMQAPRFLNSD